MRFSEKMGLVNWLMNSVFGKFLVGLLPTFLVSMALVGSLSAPAAGSAADGSDQEKAGARLFRDKGCAYCHGGAGEGTPKGPSLANLRKSWTADRMTQQILNGGQKMPAFEDSLSKDEVAQLVAWLRAKHRPAVPPAAKVSDPGQ